MWVLLKMWYVCVLVTQSCPVLCDPVDCSLLGSSDHGILQARILEWIAISFSRGSPQPRDQIHTSCIEGSFFTIWATRKALRMRYLQKIISRLCSLTSSNPYKDIHFYQFITPNLTVKNQELETSIIMVRNIITLEDIHLESLINRSMPKRNSGV